VTQKRIPNASIESLQEEVAKQKIDAGKARERS
jgi:hypothetical protein